MNVLSYAHPQLFNAMVERDRLEDDGIGDELKEMQEILWPIKILLAKDFAIDMRTTMGVRWCGARGGLLLSLRSQLISMCM
jgi:hypothetical protein